MLAALMLLGVGTVAPQQQALTADDGASVVVQSQVDARTLDLTISSPALGTSAPVRLLLPAHWYDQPDRTWPVLYLLHGCCEVADYQSWTRFTDVERFTADKDVLVVMPSDGQAGMYSKWAKSVPDWESFHLTELLQILRKGYRAGGPMAVAGLSIGGYGAMAYAFRHPGMFTAAASFSGIPDTTLPAVPEFIQSVLARVGYGPWDLWGNEFLNYQTWAEHNPSAHVDKLRGTALFVSCGNGFPGPLDPPTGADLIEPVAQVSSQAFVAALRLGGVPVTTDFYGGGTHSWPYWERELHKAWPMLAAGLRLG
nr:alpha/beta hydrolase family protein [Kutzneria albida]